MNALCLSCDLSLCRKQTPWNSTDYVETIRNLMTPFEDWLREDYIGLWAELFLRKVRTSVVLFIGPPSLTRALDTGSHQGSRFASDNRQCNGPLLVAQDVSEPSLVIVYHIH